MARGPWAVVTVAVLSALVAGGALVAAATLRDRDGDPATPGPSPTASSDIGVDGCLIEPCEVLGTAPIGASTVELVADRGHQSGRLRIGGGVVGSGDVIEVTITDMGVTLNRDSLQCVSGALSACLVRGPFSGGIAGQVVAGRSGKWSDAPKPFVSGAGYLALADVTADNTGPEVIAAQHDCDGAADCAGTQVFAQIFSIASAELGCTRKYSRLEAMPGYPAVDLSEARIRDCA